MAATSAQNMNIQGNRADGNAIMFNAPIHGDIRFPDGPGADQCLRDLFSTDPRVDMERIEAGKDRLLKDCYAWVLEDSEFCSWRHSDGAKVLWIKGDPGKGKTMIMIGLVNELSRQLDDAPESGILSYFFCQSTEPQLKSAASVLRGLIYLLVVKRKSLIHHIRKRYDEAGS